MYIRFIDNNLKMRTDIQIKGVFITREHVAVWNGEKVLVFEIIHGKAHIRPAGSFSSKSRNIMLFDQSAFIMLPDVLQVNYPAIVLAIELHNPEI